VNDHDVEYPLWSKSILVQDQTERTDPKLLEFCCDIAARAKEKKYSLRIARDIVFHYLSNFIGDSYADELKYLIKRIKQLIKLCQDYTAEEDHGWELEELRKAGLIK